MSPAARLALAAALALGAGALLAQDPGSPRGEEPAAESPGAADAAPDAAGDEEEDAEPAPRQPSSEDFIPTERIPADASIAFPVDI